MPKHIFSKIQPTVVFNARKISKKNIDLIEFSWYNYLTTNNGERYDQSIDLRKKYKKIPQDEEYDPIRACGEGVCNAAEHIEMGKRGFPNLKIPH